MVGRHQCPALLTKASLDFRRRFLTLLSYKFREFGSVTALSVLEAANAGIKDETEESGKQKSQSICQT